MKLDAVRDWQQQKLHARCIDVESRYWLDQRWREWKGRIRHAYTETSRVDAGAVIVLVPVVEVMVVVLSLKEVLSVRGICKDRR